MPNFNAVTVEDVENSIANYREDSETADRFKEMCATPAFKEFFAEGLFKTHAASLVILSNDSRLSAEERSNIIEEIKGISTVHQYFHAIVLKGDQANQQIKSGLEELAQMRETGAGH